MQFTKLTVYTIYKILQTTMEDKLFVSAPTYISCVGLYCL